MRKLGEAFAERLEVAVYPDGPGMRTVAEQAAVHLVAHAFASNSLGALWKPGSGNDQRASADQPGEGIVNDQLVDPSRSGWELRPRALGSCQLRRCRLPRSGSQRKKLDHRRSQHQALPSDIQYLPSATGGPVRRVTRS